MRTLVPIVETPTETLPVDLAEAKAFIKGLEGVGEDDGEIGQMIATAFGWLQPPTGVLAKSIALQTLSVALPCFPECVELPAGPVRAITSIKYYDENNADQTVDPTNYFLDRDVVMWKLTYSTPQHYDRPSAVRIEYTAGLATFPEPLKMAILRVVKRLYDFRDELIEGLAFDPVAFGVDALIMPWRVR